VDNVRTNNYNNKYTRKIVNTKRTIRGEQTHFETAYPGWGKSASEGLAKKSTKEIHDKNNITKRKL